MRNFKCISSLVLLYVGILFCGCNKMTEIGNEPYDHIGGYNTMSNTESGEYYADLRAYKQRAVNYDRPVASGWYSNWSSAGTYRRGCLTSIPDSVDIVSMWGGAPNRFNITSERGEDKEFVRKVKGTRLLEVTPLSCIDKDRTPDSVYTAVEKQTEKEGWANNQTRVEGARRKARWRFWGYKGVVGSDNHRQALARFAKVLYDSLVANDWDSYDIDWEVGSGVFDIDGTLSTNVDPIHLVKEISKHIDPKSDPDHKSHRLICVDRHFGGLTEDLDEYVDYRIDQAYGHVTHFDYYSVDLRTTITTDNPESSFESGGQLLRQAKSMPSKGYKGGVDAYRFDNNYDNTPSYKWTRQTVQINQQVFKKKMGQTTQS